MSPEGPIVEHASAPDDQLAGPKAGSFLGFTDLDGDGSAELLVTFAKRSPRADLMVVFRVYARSDEGAWTAAEEYPLYEEHRPAYQNTPLQRRPSG